MAITTTLSQTHTDEDRILQLYGEQGYDSILQKLGTSAKRDTHVGNVIDDATQTVDFYLWERYDPADYTSMPWVRERCTWIACHRLSLRMGNPGHFYSLHEEALEDLQAIKEGKFSLPDIALRDNNLPSVSNIKIDDTHIRARQRVDPVTSVGGTYGGQFIQYTSYFQWL